jgi:hypothetical protein
MLHRRLLLLMLILPGGAYASFFTERFIDPEDGWFDGSNFLLEYPYGVLPVPVIITEPAVGEGLGLALAYFHDADPKWEGEVVDEKGRAIARSISVGVYAKTNNESTIYGGGHLGHYRRDTIRYEGFVGKGDLNLKFYGFGIGPGISDGLDFNIEAAFLTQQLIFRLGGSDFFAGFSFDYTDVDTSIETGIDIGIPELERLTINAKNVSVALVLAYDSLNNSFTPTSGIDSEVSYSRHDEAIGSDFDYNLLDTENQVHFKLSEKWGMGIRLDTHFSDGDIPFYALPYVDLRGIPALRYQGENVITTEAQFAWSPHHRWQVLGFAGVGQAAKDISDFGDVENHKAYGVGFRYLAVKALGLNMGVDVAKGPEDTVYYIAFGTSF